MSKINSTLNGGYYTPDDMDVDALKRLAKRRQREEGERLQAKGLDAKSKRQTFMMPFNILCSTCKNTIAKRTKLYASVSVAPEKYLGRVPVAQMVIRCPQPGCGGKIRLVVNPETVTYDVVEGGVASEIQQQQHAESIAARMDNNPGAADATGQQKNEEQNKRTLENVMSFDDVRAMLFAESEAIDALGDNYVEESMQVQQIRQRVLQQQREKREAEKQQMERDQEQLMEEFEKAKIEMRGAGNYNRGEDGSSGEEGKKQKKKKDAAPAMSFSDALAETKALFLALDRAGNSSNAKPVQQANEPPKKPRKALMDMFSDDDLKK